MDKELNLIKILENAPVSTKLYSVMHGEVEFHSIREPGEYKIIVADENGVFHSYTKEGKFRVEDLGECLLYPSKECRDWSNFKVDLPEGTPVMVGDTDNDWKLRFYAGQNKVYKHGKRCGTTISWGYIIPVDKFNFTDYSFNKEDNYGFINN